MKRVSDAQCGEMLRAFISAQNAPRNKNARRGCGRTTAILAIGVMLSSGAYAAAPASNALPTGGQIVSGSGGISQSGNNLTVTQNTNQLVANWSSFNIGSQASVNFVQPGSNSVALNRISGGAAQIFGTLTANGKVYLIDPNGIIFGKTAQVNVGGLVASALDESDADFLAGLNHFSGTGAGKVINAGTISVPAGGVVALIAPQVVNAGTINASGGSVALAAGSNVTLDFVGDGLIDVAVNQAAFDAQVKNKGVIIADGGTAVMTAKSANALLNTVVNNDGVIEADTLAEKSGRIILDGGDTGAVNAGGTLKADGTQAGQTGGAITVTGNQVNVAAGAVIDASGPAGGGAINIGGGKRGQETSIADANGLTVDPTATISANATDNGNGGSVVLWSNGITNAAGSIQARGGANGGNGGYVETSGTTLNLEASLFVNDGAPKGNGGLWLMDPASLTIDSGVAATIVTGLQSGEVDESVGTGGISVTASIIATSGNTNALKLESTGPITVGAVTINTQNGNLYIGGSSGDSSTYATGQSSGQSGVVINGSTLMAGTGTITIDGEGFTPSLITGTGDVSATSSAGLGVDFQGTVSITGNTVTITGLGGVGQAVEDTTAIGPTVTGTGFFWSSNTQAGGENGSSASGGGGAVGVQVESGASVTITATTAATINATGGDGGHAAADNLGADFVDGGDGAIGYNQLGAVTFNAPTATIVAHIGGSGGASAPGFYEDESVGPQCNGDCNYDVPDGEGGFNYGGGIEEYGTTPESVGNSYGGNDGSYGMYIDGNLKNTHGSGSILNLESNQNVFQNSGALTASYVMMEGIAGNFNFTFAQSGNAIDRLATQDIDTLQFNDNDSGTQPLHVGTVSSVAGVSAENAYIQVQSTGNTGANPALIQDSGAPISVSDDLILTANTMQFNNTSGSVDGNLVAIRPYAAAQNIVFATSDPNAGGDLYIPIASVPVFSSGIGSLTFGDTSDTGNVTVSNNVSFLSSVALSTGSGNMVITGNVTLDSSNALTLQSTGTSNITGAITTDYLLLNGSGESYVLDNTSNAINNIATTNSVGTLEVMNTGDLNVVDIQEYVGPTTWNGGFSTPDGPGVYASNRVYLNTTGILYLNGPVSGQGSYTGSPTYSSPANKNVQEAAAVLLVAGGDFENQSGNSSIISTAASNRFLVYSAAPDSDADEATSFSFKMYAWDFYSSGNTGNGHNGYDYDAGGFGRSLPASTAGSGFLYVSQPTLEVAPLAQNGTYGNTPSLSTVLNTGYSLSGFVDNDSSSNDTGTPAFTTTATSGSAVGFYDISYTAATAGGLTGIVPKFDSIVLGYSVVNSTRADGYHDEQRPITISATSGQSMIYGDSVPTLNYSVTSGTLVNTGGNGALSGGLSTNATSASNIGSGYTISQGTLNNTNYAITYDGTTFTVNPRPITVSVDANQSKIDGTTDPVFLYAASYTDNGAKPALVNSNGFSGVLTRDPGELVGSYDVSQGTLRVVDGNNGNNYTLTFVPGSFKINPILDTSNFTSPQNGITGTGATNGVTASVTQSVGPGAGSNSIVTANTTPVVFNNSENNMPHGQVTGDVTLSSGNGTTPVTVTQSGASVWITFPSPAAAGSAPVPASAHAGLPLFVGDSGSGSDYSITQHDSTLGATLTGQASIPRPTDTVIVGAPVATSLTEPDGTALSITVGISATGVLVIEVPSGSLRDIDPQMAMLIGWEAARQNLGSQIDGITSVVITPASES